MDHFATLGVEPTATPEQIKSAYRRLARKYHPDVSQEPDAAEKFKSVNEAYSVLSDPQKRRQYEHAISGRETFSQGFPGDLHDLFDTLFNRPPSRFQSVLNLYLTPEQAYQGGKQSFTFQGKVLEVDIPPGVDEGEVLRVPAQDGLALKVHYRESGQFQVQQGHTFSHISLPPWLFALGGEQAVNTLGGEVKAQLPAGLQPGQRMRLAGRGMPARPHRKAGDHWVVIDCTIPPAQTTAQKKAYQALCKAYQSSK